MPRNATDAPKDQASTPRARSDTSADDRATLQAFRFNAMTGMGVAWMDAIGDMGSEVMSFIAQRIREDVKTQHRILHCKDVTELQAIQSEFVRTAVEQYNAETERLIRMSASLASAPDRSDDA